MKCNHIWEKITETTLPSGFEQVKDSGYTLERAVSSSFFNKKYILVVFCKKCGKLKKIVETNP